MDQTISSLTRSLERDPDNDDIAEQLARALATSGQHFEAYALLKDRGEDATSSELLQILGADLARQQRPLASSLGQLKGRFALAMDEEFEWLWQDLGSELLVIDQAIAALSLEELRDEDLDAVSKVQTLESLAIDDSPETTGAGLTKLATLTLLEELEYKHSGPLSAQATQVLAGLPRLASLDITETDGITDACLAPIAHAPVLASLHLSGLHLSAEGFKCLARLPSLNNLWVNYARQLSDQGLAVLARPGMKVLWLYETRALTDSGLAVLAQATDLEELGLCDKAELNDKAISKLARIPKLRRLSLSGCSKITGKSLQILAQALPLERLDLSFCEALDDSTLAPLADMASLKILELVYCQDLSDAALNTISRLPGLEFLDLSNCQQITLNGLRQLTALSGSLKTLVLEELAFDRSEVMDALPFLEDLEI